MGRPGGAEGIDLVLEMCEGSDLVWDGLTQTKMSKQCDHTCTFLLNMKMTLVVEPNIPLWMLAAELDLQSRKAASVRSIRQSLSMSTSLFLKNVFLLGSTSRRAD